MDNATYLVKTPNTGEQMICNICHTPLAYETIANVIGGYVHLLNTYDTHIPHPVPERETIHIEYVCDFCSTVDKKEELGTVWVSNRIVKRVGDKELDLSPDWAVCRKCLSFVMQGLWIGLVEYCIWKFAENNNTTEEKARKTIAPLFQTIQDTFERYETPEQANATK